MKQPKINIVVVTFNRSELLKECLNALLAQHYENYKVYLINNASTDNTEEMIKQNFTCDSIVYYNTGENLGGAGGFNYGIRKAASDDCDYIWLMDDDTIVKEDSLEKLVQYADKLNNDFGFLSSFVKFTDGTPCQMNIPTLYGDDNNKNREWLNTYQFTDPEEKISIIHGTFVAFFVRKEVVKKVGLPIKEFFIWADDTEYSLRISKEYKNYFCKDSVVIHKMKENKASTLNDFINCSPERVSRYYYSYRNKFYIAKNRGSKASFRYRLRILKHIVFVLLKSKEKSKKLKVICRGYRDGRKFAPEVEYI